MKKPSEMPREIDIHFFRDNLVPMWEDSPEGGIVILKIKKDDNIDKMWESILFAMVGKCRIGADAVASKGFGPPRFAENMLLFSDDGVL